MQSHIQWIYSIDIIYQLWGQYHQHKLQKGLEQSSKRIYINFKYVCPTRCIGGNNNKNCRLQYPFHESFRIERDVSYKSQNIMHEMLFCQGQRKHFKKFFCRMACIDKLYLSVYSMNKTFMDVRIWNQYWFRLLFWHRDWACIYVTMISI